MTGSAALAIAALTTTSLLPGTAEAASAESAFGRFDWAGERVHGARDDASVLFAVARVIPPDATGLVHVEDAARIRSWHGERPATDAALGLLGESRLATAWAALADRANVDPRELFDDLLGERFSIAVRDVGRGTEWAAILDLNRAEIGHRLAAWGADRAWPLDVGVDVWNIPAAAARVFLLPNAVVVCGQDTPKLGEDVARRIAAAKGRIPREPIPPAFGLPVQAGRPSLADHPGIEAGRTLGRGSIAGLIVHDDDQGGGWSAHLVDALDERAPSVVRMSVAASFDGPPIERPPTALSWSGDVVTGLADRFMLVTAEPTDIGWGRGGAQLSRALDAPILSRGLRRVLRDRRLLIVDEVHSGAVAAKGDDAAGVPAGVPAAALVLEVADIGAGVQIDLDLHMGDILDGIGRSLAADAFGGGPAAIAPTRVLATSGTGFAELGPAMAAWWDGDPNADASDVPAHIAGMDLAWGVARSADAAWIVIATHSEHLDSVVEAIETVPRTAAESPNGWTSRGVVNGRRAEMHLSALAADADRVVGIPGGGEALAESCAALSAFFGTLERAAWRLRRPDADSIRLEIELDLRDDDAATAAVDH